MPDAPHPKQWLPKHVWSRPGRKGQRMLYFRIKRMGAKPAYFRLPDDPASAAFHARYADLLEQIEKGKPAPVEPDTIGSLVAAFKASPEFARLSPNTRTYHATHLDCLAKLATYPATSLDRGMVLKLRDKLRDKPRSADQRVAVIRRLYTFAIDRRMVTANPALRIGRLDVDGGSYEPWSLAERERFEQSNPPRHFLTAYMLACYASPRRGDILRLTRAHYDGDVIRLFPQKTKRKGVRRLVVPCHSKLRAHLDSLGIEVGLLVPGPNGRPWEPSAFSNAFRCWLDGIGLQGRHMHGLRHTCLTSLIEAGCSDEEAMSVSGHSDSKTLKIYTSQVRQELLARRAIAKLEAQG